MSANPLCFVDTNILLYAYSDSDDPRSAKAFALLQRLLTSDQLCTSTQVLQELLFNLRKKKTLPTVTAIMLVENLAQFPCFQVDVFAITQANLAADRHKISYWDALILTAAARLGATTIYSEDLNHGQHYDGIELINPFA